MHNFLSEQLRNLGKCVFLHSLHFRSAEPPMVPRSRVEGTQEGGPSPTLSPWTPSPEPSPTPDQTTTSRLSVPHVSILALCLLETCVGISPSICKATRKSLMEAWSCAINPHSFQRPSQTSWSDHELPGDCQEAGGLP